MKQKIVMVTMWLLIAGGLVLLAATPSWIQYNERVVGENSPLYDDVVNRPMKTIWANFTSQHTTEGEHKTAAYIYPQIYSQEFCPDIPTNSMAFWIDGYTGKFYLVLDYNDTQRVVEMVELVQ